MKADAREYSLDFFKKHGFHRKKCQVCGSWFWTLNPKQNTCSDTPCSEYEFFELDLKVKRLSVPQVRSLFIRFFEKQGHKPVAPKPVVARWRDDLYLTIASIVVFQPFVTNGIVPPPANPLVISQPCIRLEDIDFVGKTMGRHLTSFEMAAHHAFNYPDKTVYWKDKTVEYAFHFFTDEMGVPPEELSFKEAWWEGGGNAGPCFEVTVRGLEVATLVFMKYKTVDGEYLDIPVKVVDTGYGVERIAWLAQRSPTGFHAVYGNLVDRFHEKLGVEQPDEDVLLEASKTVSTIDVEAEGMDRFYATLAARLSSDVETVKRTMERVENVYALLDHTRTLAFMLSDGIVPSNSGEGYLARLVIRRAIKALRAVRAEVPLHELVELQLDLWGRDFPRMLSRRSYILEVLRIEEEKYAATLKKGQAIVSRLVKRYTGKMIPIDELVKLYDSNGIPPEIVRETAEAQGARVEIPPNFYSIVAKRHSSAGVVRGERRIPRELEDKIASLPPTKRLFHLEPYRTSFKARVLFSAGEYLVLDQTCFYPEGGGAASDVGTIRFDGVEVRVVDVQKIGDVVVHKLEKPVEVPVGEHVEGTIDWEHRYSIMRHHTATHVILSAARRVLGEHVWQAGAEKTADKSRLDITHYELPSPEIIRKIEEAANRVVEEGRRVDVKTMPRLEAESKYGFELYQGGVPPDPEIRVVEVEGWDAQACFGVHVSNTRELGLIKVVDVDKIQDGVIRLEFVAGRQTLRYLWELEKLIHSVARELNASPQELVSRVRRVTEEARDLRRRLNKYREMWLREEAERLINSRIPLNSLGDLVVGVYSDTPRDDLIDLAKYVLKAVERPVTVLLGLNKERKRGDLIVSLSDSTVRAGIRAEEVLKIISTIVQVRGGGRGTFAQGAISPVEESEEDLKTKIINVLVEKLRR